MAIGMRRVFVRAPWEQLEGTLMDGQTSPTQGQWLDPLSYYPLAVTVSGPTWTGTIFVVVSNQLTCPRPSEPPGNFPIFGDPGGITGPMILTVDQPFKWMLAWSPDLSCPDPGVTVSFCVARPLGQREF